MELGVWFDKNSPLKYKLIIKVMKKIKILEILFTLLLIPFVLNAQSEQTEKEENRRQRIEVVKSLPRVYAPQPRSSSELSFSKSFESESINTEKDFIINKSSKSISLMLSGEAEEGTINLTLVKPDGEEYQVLQIDNASDLRWRQSFALSEEEDSEYFGKWKIKIKAENATGNYMFRMMAH